MVGGKVIRVDEAKSKVRIECQDGNDKATIFVEKNEDSQAIEPGDTVWWQGKLAYWTPTTGVDQDVAIPRLGFSF